MMKNILLLAMVLGFVSCTLFTKREPQTAEASRWFIEQTFYDVKHPYLANPLVRDVNLRTGYYRESAQAEFKGCVMYLEGLADSVANQQPLFHHLSESGYRTVFFDYMGQGGSEGSMNNSRVLDPINNSLQISTQAQFVWNKYSEGCKNSKKIVIGWSTGGLVSYKMAAEGWADAVVLIAPGIHTKMFIGEAAKNPSDLLTFQQVISERTLTRNTFSDGRNPHVEPIKPTSPAKVPLFATNLVAASKVSQTWKISEKVKGLVFLSGVEDTYVDRDATIATLKRNAAHFGVVSYDGALHEIQNEIPEVAHDMYQKTTQFLNHITSAY
ncbi:MAG: alpha/beta fold hydrolase [Pseudobdellovibrio sp.]|nr:alpha/beta fold hydrolase [Pseudobdellovibrio sp.]